MQIFETVWLDTETADVCTRDMDGSVGRIHPGSRLYSLALMMAGSFTSEAEAKAALKAEAHPPAACNHGE